MTDDHKVVLEFMKMAQTIVAIYQSPEGPTSCAMAFDMLAQLLNDPRLLRAQLNLAPQHETIMLVAEPNGPTVVLPLSGGAN